MIENNVFIPDLGYLLMSFNFLKNENILNNVDTFLIW
jgi:hypothetical protein